jgi:hypothetical protein
VEPRGAPACITVSGDEQRQQLIIAVPATPPAEDRDAGRVLGSGSALSGVGGGEVEKMNGVTARSMTALAKPRRRSRPCWSPCAAAGTGQPARVHPLNPRGFPRAICPTPRFGAVSILCRSNCSPRPARCGLELISRP